MDMNGRMPGVKLMNMQRPGGEDRYCSTPFCWFLCVVYTLLLTVLSLMPSSSLEKIPLVMPNEDKVAHFFVYGFLVLVIWWAMRLLGTGAVKKLFIVAFLCSLYGLFIEFMQEILQPGDRVFSLWDALANMGGALSAALLLRYWTKDKKISQVYLR